MRLKTGFSSDESGCRAGRSNLIDTHDIRNPVVYICAAVEAWLDQLNCASNAEAPMNTAAVQSVSCGQVECECRETMKWTSLSLPSGTRDGWSSGQSIAGQRNISMSVKEC